MTTVRAHYSRSCYPDAPNEVIATVGRAPQRSATDPIARNKAMMQHDEWDCQHLEEAQRLAQRLETLHGVRVEME